MGVDEGIDVLVGLLVISLFSVLTVWFLKSTIEEMYSSFDVWEDKVAVRGFAVDEVPKIDLNGWDAILMVLIADEYTPQPRAVKYTDFRDNGEKLPVLIKFDNTFQARKKDYVINIFEEYSTKRDINGNIIDIGAQYLNDRINIGYKTLDKSEPNADNRNNSMWVIEIER